MGWQGIFNRDTHMLRRIVAILLALAASCERAAAMPKPVRRAALWVLTLAFSATQQLVAEEADAFGFEADFSAMDGFEPDDDADALLQLAGGFAGLAQMLAILVGHIHEMAGNNGPEHSEIVNRLEARLHPLLRDLQDRPLPGVAIIDTS